MYQVYYRCTYREYWYSDLETEDYQTAVSRARMLQEVGRRVTVVDGETGAVVYGENVARSLSQQ